MVLCSFSIFAVLSLLLPISPPPLPPPSPPLPKLLDSSYRVILKLAESYAIPSVVFVGRSSGRATGSRSGIKALLVILPTRSSQIARQRLMRCASSLPGVRGVW